MGVPVLFTPQALNFGGVVPGSIGPNIAVDPSLGPPAVSFAGGVEIKEVPADAKVSASVEGDGTFKVRDIIVMEWVLEDVDPSELPPGHHGRLPKVKVLEVVTQSDGAAPVGVKVGQFVLVRAMYVAPSREGSFKGVLVIEGDTWNRIEIPLSLFPAGVSTRFLNTPVKLPRGKQTIVPIEVSVIAGGDAPVQYSISQTQLHSGITLVGTSSFLATKTPLRHTLTMATTLDAPLGDHALAVDQTAFNIRTGMLVPTTILLDPEPNDAQIAIARKAAELAAVLGNAVSPIQEIAITDGFVQRFERGDIYYAPALGAHAVYGEIKAKYDQMGGPDSLLGFPESDVTLLPDRHGQFCDFHAASIYAHPQIGPRVVADPVRQSWRSQGAQAGNLGYPCATTIP